MDIRNKNLRAFLARLKEEHIGQHSPYRNTLGAYSDFGVTHEQEDLFLAVAEHAWTVEGYISPALWAFAQRRGEGDFRRLSATIDLHLMSSLEDMQALLNAGMSVDEILTHPYYADGKESGILTARGILLLREHGVPGDYYTAMCNGLTWYSHPTTETVIDFYIQGVPPEYASALFQEEMDAERISACWADGIPLDYATGLARA